MHGNRKIEAVVFDVDGTLYPNYKMYVTSLLFFVIHPLLAQAFRKMRKKIRRHSNPGNFRQQQAEILAEELGTDKQKALFLLDKYIYGQFIRMFRWIRPYRALGRILSQLREENIRLGIISDFPVKEKLSYLGLDQYWDEICSADELGFLKPRPEAFMHMAERLGIEPGKIIYVGNHYLYDIIGANNAGMLSAHFSRFRRKDTRADFTFTDYRKLGNYILGSVKS